MFFCLKIHERRGASLGFGKDCRIRAEGLMLPEYALEVLHKRLLGVTVGEVTCEEITFKKGYPAAVKKRIAAAQYDVTSSEGFAILLGKKTTVYALQEGAFVFAAATLLQLADFGELACGFIYDAPELDTRGYRVFLPGRSHFADFKRIVDLLAYYKYNSMILEIGGAMEYKRHPRINERWAEFCKEVHAYSGRAREIQTKLYPWRKNAIHCDNAEGDVLTQEECRELAAYCRSRGLEVIPECPTYSHCDYLVMAYPELREREGDAYPDTYCSRHPDVYKYVFDILDEVIEVFAPKRINIGHDEMYSIGACERCRSIKPHVLYAEDVHKINDYLKSRGVATIMWGEKVLNARAPVTHRRYGGAGSGKGINRVPMLYPCRDLLPKDVTYLHWYWNFNAQYDKVYHERGFKVIFGNLSVLEIEDWSRRVAQGIRGAFVSNWGSFLEEYMQRNIQYLDLISGAYAFWCADFEALGKHRQLMLAMRECHRIKIAHTKAPLYITHTAHMYMPHTYFYDGMFIEDEKYLLGQYELTYTDGTSALLPVKYGTHIGAYSQKEPVSDRAFKQVAYTTMPKGYREGFAYECVYEDPHPEGQISSITFKPSAGFDRSAVELIGFSRERAASVNAWKQDVQSGCDIADCFLDEHPT